MVGGGRDSRGGDGRRIERAGAAVAVEDGGDAAAGGSLGEGTADGGEAGGGFAAAGRRLLAAERPGGAGAVQIDSRRQSQAAPDDHGQPLGSAGREPAV